jgi:hypothetical protein
MLCLLLQYWRESLFHMQQFSLFLRNQTFFMDFVHGQNIPFAASFWFCVIPFTHLFRRSPFDNLEEIGSTSLINKSGKQLSLLYVDVPFVLFFQHLHRVSLNRLVSFIISFHFEFFPLFYNATLNIYFFIFWFILFPFPCLQNMHPLTFMFLLN